MTARIGFIGLGIMGAPMAGHLLAAGHPVAVTNRSRGPRAEALVAAGARWCDSPAAVAAAADVIITILGFPQDVAEVWLGEAGLVAQARPGAVLVDMTTSSPRLARDLAAAAAGRGVAALDAPVSGGEAGAKGASLSIMVGGSGDAFDSALPVLQRMGKTIRRMGEAGAGQHAKMANQVIIASTLMGVAEGLSYARAAGLDGAAVLEALAPGAAGSFQLNMLGLKMLAGDFAPGFMLKHFLKDLGIAVAEAEAMRLDLPGLAQARRLCQAAAETRGAEAGTQAIIASYAA